MPFFALSNTGLIIGSEGIYTVDKGDTLELIASKLGLEKRVLIEDNNLDPKTRLTPGMKLKVNTKKIIPKYVENGIIINIPDRMLYFFKDGAFDAAFPVSLGMPTKMEEFGDIEWKTPEGKFKVLGKTKDPIWYVPKSIQMEMELLNKPVVEKVLPGKDNPLGRYAIRTSLSGFLIHETIWPTSIYRYRSHGCARMLPQHMEVLFPKVKKDMEGEIIYKPVKVALIDNKKVYLEVHRDVYKKFNNLEEEAKKEIEIAGLLNVVDWEKAKRVIKEKKGVAEDVTDYEKIKMAFRKKSMLEKIAFYLKNVFSKGKNSRSE
ncbi:MAG: L,D-transpeptidase family protein [Syntrophorhabdaceae bacterium]|nr:L,D-transpeptidase family protein [Syntrophorhabdaceae bacterium]